MIRPLRFGLWAGALWSALSLAAPAPTTAEPVAGKSWQIAQAPNADSARGEDERRKRRGERSERQDRGEESRRAGPREKAPPSVKPPQAQQERREAPRRQEAQPQRPVPTLKEARPPAQPAIINKRRTGEVPDAGERLRAKQKEVVEDRRDTRGERRDPREERRDNRQDAREERRDDSKDAREERREVREERRDDRRDAREERRDGRKDAREERRDDRKDAREERRDDRRDAREDRKEDRAETRIRRLDDLKQLRRQRVEDGGRRTIIEEPDKRIIVREHGRTFIRHDDTERFRRRFKDTRVERRDGNTVTTFIRPDGVHIVSVVDGHGRLLHRYRRHRDGRVVVLIDNRRYHRRPGFVDGLILGAFLDLRPPVIRIPREKYIVDYEDASYDDVYEALEAPPVDDVERGYSLDEIRYNHYLRERMRRIDLDSINFDFGSWEVGPDQYYKLERIAKAINRLLDRNSDEIIMIEGYTDAVGSDEDNLTLSDHRAEAVAAILTEEFDVPPENLVTQGYGEQFLKIDTQEPERANRRVAVRRITPLLSRSGD